MTCPTTEHADDVVRLIREAGSKARAVPSGRRRHRADDGPSSARSSSGSDDWTSTSTTPNGKADSRLRRVPYMDTTEEQLFEGLYPSLQSGLRERPDGRAPDDHPGRRRADHQHHVRPPGARLGLGLGIRDDEGRVAPADHESGAGASAPQDPGQCHRHGLYRRAPASRRARRSVRPQCRACRNRGAAGPGAPSDIYGAAVYLASDDARYVTGTHILVDGGLLLPPITRECRRRRAAAGRNNSWASRARHGRVWRHGSASPARHGQAVAARDGNMELVAVCDLNAENANLWPMRLSNCWAPTRVSSPTCRDGS